MKKNRNFSNHFFSCAHAISNGSSDITKRNQYLSAGAFVGDYSKRCFGGVLAQSFLLWKCNDGHELDGDGGGLTDHGHCSADQFEWTPPRNVDSSILREFPLGRLCPCLSFWKLSLTLAGVFCGMFWSFDFNLCSRLLESEYGFVMTSLSPSTSQILFCFWCCALGIVIGLFPAWRSMKLSLKDGLRIS